MSNKILIEQETGDPIAIDKSNHGFVFLSIGDQKLPIERENIEPLCEMLLLIIKKSYVVESK